jgi:DNA-binding CsgD family transcriptional regulator
MFDVPHCRMEFTKKHHFSPWGICPISFCCHTARCAPKSRTHHQWFYLRKRLSTALLDLYGGAQNKHITVLPRYALEIIKTFIDFDTAMMGLAKMELDGKITASYAFNNEEEAQINDEYLSISNKDPIIKSIFGAPGKAVNFDVTKVMNGHAERDNLDFALRIRHLHNLAIASRYGPKHGQLGLSLRRADAKWAYQPEETVALNILMPHVRESFRINRGLFSQQLVLSGTEPIGGFCIFDASGVIGCHDTPFEHLMRGAFQDFVSYKMPPILLKNAVENSQSQQNRHAVGHLTMQAGWVGPFCFLSVRPRNKLDALTSREQVVAQFYGTGLTYKEIGQELSISPATVRRHIEATYGKLNVKNKADLALLVRTQSDTMSSEKRLAKLAPQSRQ